MPGLIEFVDNSSAITYPASPGVILTSADTSFNSTTGTLTIGNAGTINGSTDGILTTGTNIFTTGTSAVTMTVSNGPLIYDAVTIQNVIYQMNASLSNSATTLTNCITGINITCNGINMAYSNAAWNALVQQQIANNIVTGTNVGNTITITGSANDTVTTTMAAWTILVGRVHQAHLTEEQQAQYAEEQRLAQERYAVQQKESAVKKEAANVRAERLLRTALSPQQVAELEAKNHFTLQVYSKSGERKLYRIQRGRSGNVKQVDESGRVLKTLCAHPIAAVPDADTMLAQKLMLEREEEVFLRIANHS